MDTTTLTTRDVTEDSVRPLVEASFKGRDPEASKDEIDDAVAEVLFGVQAHNSWRESRPMDEQLALRDTPVVNAFDGDTDPAEGNAVPSAPASDPVNTVPPAQSVPPTASL